MRTRNIDIFKGHHVIGNIIPAHGNWVSGILEHFDDGTKFITLSEDGSLAITNSETLEIVKFDNFSSAPITAACMVNHGGKKNILIGNRKGELEFFNSDYKKEMRVQGKRMEINTIVDFGDGTIVVTHGDDDLGSVVEYISLDDLEVINRIILAPTRKIKSMRRLEGVKDKCVVACSACNIYWLKVIDGNLKLLIDQPSPDDYYYDDVWSNGKSIFKAGQACYRRNEAPIFIKNRLFGEREETKGQTSAMDIKDGVIIRTYQGELRITDMDGMTLNKIHLPQERFATHVTMQPFGRIIMGFSSGEIGRFEFRNQSLRLIVD